MAGAAIVNKLFKGMFPELPGESQPIRKGMFGNLEEKPPEITKPEMVVGPEGISRISAMIGENGNSAFDKNFKIAEQMRRKGDTNEDIIARTGFWFDEAGTPKYEIDDSNAMLKFDPAKAKAGQEVLASDFIQHDDLFAIYPDLAKMPVKFIKNKNPEAKGYLDLDKNEIGLNINNKDFVEEDSIELVASMLHEMQHALQKREKFDQGGDWNKFLKDPNKFTPEEYKEAYKKYVNIAGEVEARNVEFRFSNPKRAKEVFDFNKKMGFNAVKPMPNVVRSKNFLQTLAKDPISAGYGIDPRTTIDPAGNPARMLSDVEDPRYQDPFEKAIPE